MSKKVQGLIAINIAALLFGSAALFGKLEVSPLWIVAMRAVFAFFTLLLVGALKSQLRMPPKQLGRELFISGLILCVHWMAFFLSVQLSGIAIATLTFASFPLFTVLIENFKNRRGPNSLELISGVAIIFAVKLLVNVNILGWNERLGAVAGISSALAFAFFGVFSKKLTGQLSAISLSLCQNGIVILILLPLLPFSGRPPSHFHEWGLLLILGVVTTALMHQLYLYALKRLSAATCSGFVALEPAYALLFASLLFKEPLSWVVLISCVLIFSASLLLLFQENRGFGSEARRGFMDRLRKFWVAKGISD